MSISRLYTFTPNTLARSSEVNAELDQLVSEVNVMFKKDGSSPMTGDLEIEKPNPAIVLDGQETSAAGFRIRSAGANIAFDRYVSSVWVNKLSLGSSVLSWLDEVDEEMGFRVISAAPTADTHDAFLALRVNNSAANEWKLVVDNSDSKILKFQYGGVTKFQFDTTGVGTPSGGSVAPYFEPTTDDTSAPVANRLYQANVPKAWAFIDFDASPGTTITHDHNIASASWGTVTLTVNLDTDMADASYYPAVRDLTLVIYGAFVGTLAAGSFLVSRFDYSTLSSVNYTSAARLGVVIFGVQ